MPRVWIEDRDDHESYRAAVAKAKQAKRTPPGRWRVRWYDPAGKPKAKTFPKKPQAESYRTGLRWGETSALRVGQVNLDARRIQVVTAFNEDDGELYEDTPKTGERRTVPIPVSLVAELKPLVDGRDEEALVFTTARGRPLRLRNWRYREFYPALAPAGLGGIGLSPHKLRHTAASLAIAAGADVKVVQTMLGHRSATMTLDIYGHLWPDRLDEVADVMDARRLEALTATEGGAIKNGRT